MRGIQHGVVIVNLRKYLAAPEIVVAPGVFDAFSALLAASADLISVVLAVHMFVHVRLSKRVHPSPAFS